jgi:hypothetical protein
METSKNKAQETRQEMKAKDLPYSPNPQTILPSPIPSKYSIPPPALPGVSTSGLARPVIIPNTARNLVNPDSLSADVLEAAHVVALLNDGGTMCGSGNADRCCGLPCGLSVGSENFNTTRSPRRVSYVLRDTMEEEDWVRERMRVGVGALSGLGELEEETRERMCGGVVVRTMLRELEEWVRDWGVWCPDIICQSDSEEDSGSTEMEVE